MRGGYFAEPDDEWGFPRAAFYSAPDTKIMAYELFGVGKHHPAPPPHKTTMEELERLLVWTSDYQRRLQEGPDAKWDRPENEEALMAAYKAGPDGYSDE